MKAHASLALLPHPRFSFPAPVYAPCYLSSHLGIGTTQKYWVLHMHLNTNLRSSNTWVNVIVFSYIYGLAGARDGLRLR